MLRFVGGDKLYGANRVVVLNDAVQKALPITWVPNPMRKALLKLEHISTHELEIWFSRLGGSRTGYMAHGELQRAVLALLEDKPHLAEVK